jgi:hypothetical protein
VLKGDVSAKHVEAEFTRLLSRTWRWTARKVADNKFTVRFPSVQLIKDCGRFNPVKMKTVKAKIQIDQWNWSIGAKAELQCAWFRVRGIPSDKKSEEIAAYVGSLVGATVEVDEASLQRPDYVRVKIAAQDVSKVPEIVEGAIIPFLYDFYYEREMEMGDPNPGVDIRVTSEKKESESNSKDGMKEGQSSVQAQGLVEIFILAVNRSENQKGKVTMATPPNVSLSAPPKVGMSKDAKTKEEIKRLFLKYNAEEDRELMKFMANEERVQGLSGNDTISLENGEVAYEDVQGSQTKERGYDEGRVDGPFAQMVMGDARGPVYEKGSRMDAIKKVYVDVKNKESSVEETTLISSQSDQNSIQLR